MTSVERRGAPPRPTPRPASRSKSRVTPDGVLGRSGPMASSRSSRMSAMSAAILSAAFLLPCVSARETASEFNANMDEESAFFIT